MSKYFTWIVGILLLASLHLQAYVFTNDITQGAYWPTFPIQMQVVVPTNDGGLLWSLVKECEQEWEDALGSDIWDIRQAGPGDQNTIYWEDNFGQVTGYNPNQTLALTLRYQQGGLMSQVKILLNGSSSLLRQNWSNLLKKTLLHEMGHTIGLDHSTEPAIMQAYIGQYGELENDDITGGNAVVDEQRHRQAIGYISPLSAKDQKMVSCATISFTNSDGGPLSLSFLFSLILGGLPLFLLRYCRKVIMEREKFSSL